MLSNIKIVLVGTTHPGNIGAAARAMKNMTMSRLVLVQPKVFPSAEATARASGADDLLSTAEVHDSLDSALAGCRLVIGSSARDRRVEWPMLDPRTCAAKLTEEARQGEVALLFGRESSGLSNEELDRCHYLVRIPTNPAFSSLNIAAAVQLLAYELQLSSTAQAVDSPKETDGQATADMMQGFYEHLELTLYDIGFAHPGQSRKLLRRLRRLFNRAQPDEVELNILRGILSAAQGAKTMRKAKTHTSNDPD